MFHYRNLIHEDDDMMRAFRVIDTDKGKNPSTAEPFIRNNLINIIYSNWKYSDPMLTELAAKPTALMPTLDSTYMQNMLATNIYRIFYPNGPLDIAADVNTNP